MSIADPHLMLAFEGTEMPEWLRHRLEVSPPAGVTLFRAWNVVSPQQVAELTAALQGANSSPLPLLIAVDQEGGQLIGLAGATPFAGNMALGATADPDLAREVAFVIGTELASVGVNVNYAPVADVATQAHNPSLGIRSFGDDPDLVARLTAAMVQGLGAAGVLATLKHFPGSGEATVDPHHHLPLLDLDRGRLEAIELPPFRAGIEAGVKLLMVAHQLVPALTGSDEVPICGSKQGIDGFVRGELGFDGLVMTDALDMGALDQGPAQVVEIIAMMRGGTDLLLCMPDPALQDRAVVAMERGYSRGLIPDEVLQASVARIEKLRGSLKVGDPHPELVGSDDHMRLAADLADRSVTLVRNDVGLIPLTPGDGRSILCLEPEPVIVTLADTTTFYPARLAEAIQTKQHQVSGIVYPHHPEQNDIAAAVDATQQHDLVVVATVNATPGQARLVEALLATGKPVVTVALRTPYDLAAYPGSQTHLCTYGSHWPSLRALASALFGEIPLRGCLPVAIPDLYPSGHGVRL
jgi:beta-N-acetylhexosaminidase